MARPYDRYLAAVRKAVCVVLCGGAGGCSALPFPFFDPGPTDGQAGSQELQIQADVTAIDSTTQLPTRLTGTITGDATGTYSEEILEVYFDESGAPIAAWSRSELALESPEAGKLISLNLIVVSELLTTTDATGAPILDDQGRPVVAGLRSASNGEIIFGDGAFADCVGELRSDSVLSFGTGASGMGSLESTVIMRLDEGNEDVSPAAP